MSRIPYLQFDELDSAGQEVWQHIAGSRGAQLTNEQGGLIGPFNAFVTAPGVGRHLSALGEQLRFKTSIDRRLSELAIITVGARWKAEFEWWAHARMARERGVPEQVVEAIGQGREPAFESDDEAVIYTAAQQLATTGQLDAPAYAAAHLLLGDAAMVEFVALCGYYTLVSFLLNAFEVPLPPGASPMWTDEPVT